MNNYQLGYKTGRNTRLTPSPLVRQKKIYCHFTLKNPQKTLKITLFHLQFYNNDGHSHPPPKP